MFLLKDGESGSNPDIDIKGNFTMSEYLKTFKNKTGKSIFQLNMACYALGSVENLEKIDAQDVGFRVNFSTNNPKDAARATREYIIRSTLVYVFENFYIFLKNLIQDRMESAWKDFQNSGKGKAENIKDFLQKKDFHFGAESYISVIYCLAKWRNRIIHDSLNKLPEPLKSGLLADSNYYSKNHGNINIEQFIKHFEEDKPTLKDVSTIISVTIRSAEVIDQVLCREPVSAAEIIEKIKKNPKTKEEFYKLMNKVKLKKLSKEKEICKIKLFCANNKIDVNEQIAEDLISSFYKTV